VQRQLAGVRQWLTAVLPQPFAVPACHFCHSPNQFIEIGGLTQMLLKACGGQLSTICFGEHCCHGKG